MTYAFENLGVRALSITQPRERSPEARLFEALDHPRAADRPYLSIWSHGGFEEWTWDDWRELAESSLLACANWASSRGMRVACVLTNAPAVCSGVLAVWLAGGVVASLLMPRAACPPTSTCGSSERSSASSTPMSS